MSFFTERKTLLVGALSLFCSVTAVSVAQQSSSQSAPFFTQSGKTPVLISEQVSNESQTYILQGLGRDALVSAVESVGGSVAREFPIIQAISAYLSTSQVDELADVSGLRLTADRKVQTAALGALDAVTSLPLVDRLFSIDNHIATQVGADRLHDLGITGKGVTVAVLDSGTLMGGEAGEPLLRNTINRSRAFHKYDAIQSVRNGVINDDQNGHGSHISGIIASSLKAGNGKYNGIAPDVYLLSVKAFDEQGNGSYTDVLDGLNYIYMNRDYYQIRVLNLSLGAEVKSNYWNDPINQAIMRLWDAGIVVVTSAGNDGGSYGSVTVPGNNPYVITVGAITDSYTPDNTADDRITTFSAQGPTYEGFVKPELVSFGGHVSSKMNKDLLINQNFIESLLGLDYYQVSGTSQAAAIVTGTAALMLQHNPYLSPDDVKCRLIDSANSVTDPQTGKPYGPFTQGAGVVDAYAAVASTASNCANVGLDIQADLAGIKHFRGPAMVSADGELAIQLNTGKVLAQGTDWTVIEGTDWTNLEGTDWTNLEGTDWTNLEGTDWTNLEGTDWTNLEGTDWTSLEGTDWANLEGTDWTNLEGTDWTNLEGTDWTNLEGTDWDGRGVNVESASGVTGLGIEAGASISAEGSTSGEMLDPFID